jgi:acetyltransferase-like isoleucine patch superfamily enzyme/glycosyltransferase involved in cell wall biosynthesis
MPIDFLIPTFNEAINLPHALASVRGWAANVFVLDSGSTDNTVALARSLGATVVEHPWEGYARQKNWALENLPLSSDWTFILDADESVTPPLREELERLTTMPTGSVHAAGFYVNRLFFFMGRPIRHCGYFPSWNLRLFKRGTARYEDRAIHEHMVLQGPEAYLRNLLHHEDRRGLEYYIAKHNRYSSLEAELIVTTGKRAGHDNGSAAPQRAGAAAGALRPRLFGNALERRRFLRTRIYPLLPGKFLARFAYMYVLQLGFMDGLNGLRFCLLIATHEFFIYLKVLEFHQHALAASPAPADTAAARIVTGASVMPAPVPPARLSVSPGAAHPSAARPSAAPPDSPAAEIIPPQPPDAAVPADSADPPLRQSSTWTFSEKVKRVVWMFAQASLFRWSFHNWYGWRAGMLRFFGARIGNGVQIRPSVSVEIPWHLSIGAGTHIGDYAILYALGEITIGRNVTISQYAHLCAGTHDHTTRRFPLVRLPITVQDEAWIAADAFVGPGVTVGARAVVGARASAFADVPADTVVGGSPAKVIKPRVLRD